MANEMYNWQCKHCSTVIQSGFSTPNNRDCPSGGNHYWMRLGEVGDINWQCKKCGTIIKGTDNTPGGDCPKGANTNHVWNKL